MRKCSEYCVGCWRNWGEWMDEILEEERREALNKHFAEIADKDLLTNQDALMIIEILHQACARKKAEIYEDMISGMLENGE